MSYAQSISKLKEIQNKFAEKYGVNDIYSNSKIYEIILADLLGHELIPGHAGSRDAKNSEYEFEYKHFKESSSNHSWTFNDYSDSTIEKMNDTQLELIFAHVNDQEFPPRVDWLYKVDGPNMSRYMVKYTHGIENQRKMINVSSKQIEERLGITKIKPTQQRGLYADDLDEIFAAISELEKITGVSDILTSNKFWEVVVANELGHQVNSEQGGRAGAHDASDSEGNWYEYKVVVNQSWNFQDISEAVLEKYFETKAVICARVNKQTLTVDSIYSISPQTLVPELRIRLNIKSQKAKEAGKEIRRNAITLSKSSLLALGAQTIM